MTRDEIKKQIWIYDIETLSNCFTYSAIAKDSDEIKKYVIWGKYNQFETMLVHLSECSGMVGFNNLAFDYPVLHWMIKNRNKLVTYTGDKAAKLIYKESQRVIGEKWAQIKDMEVTIPQLDLFTIHHFNNMARITSLKKLEINMDFDNVQDMPIKHTDKVNTAEQVKEILEYNINDIKATKKFYEISQPKVELRRGLIKKYGLNCINYPDSKLGEELMLKLYCENTGDDESNIKRKRTHRKSFKFVECIPQYIKFQTEEFNNMLEYLKGIEVNEIKGSFKYSVEYKDFAFDMGTGGLHGCIKPGIYKEDKDNFILDVDVAGMYPAIAVTNRYYPEHLGEVFVDIYGDELIKPRMEGKKQLGVEFNADLKVMVDGYKLAGNSVYGKSNSEYSFLCDPLYTLKTTLTGQLCLCMLSEMLMLKLPNLLMIQANTDGISFKVGRKDKKIIYAICKWWEDVTGLVLEYGVYKQMIIRDVNSYIAEYDNGKIKYKGALRPKNVSIKEGDWHKNLSQDVVTQAIAKYFLEGKEVENTIRNHDKIYDFCKMFNATHGWTCETLDKNKDEEKNIKEQQKTNRYYISTIGSTFRKTKEDKIIEIEAGNRLVTIFNKHEEKPFTKYNIDYEYYIEEAYKIIHRIDGTEEKLNRERIAKREQEKRDREEEKFLKYIIEKSPTEIQYETHRRDWLIEKYGEPKEIRPSKTKSK